MNVIQTRCFVGVSLCLFVSFFPAVSQNQETANEALRQDVLVELSNVVAHMDEIADKLSEADPAVRRDARLELAWSLWCDLLPHRWHQKRATPMLMLLKARLNRSPAHLQTQRRGAEN